MGGREHKSDWTPYTRDGHKLALTHTGSHLKMGRMSEDGVDGVLWEDRVLALEQGAAVTTCCVFDFGRLAISPTTKISRRQTVNPLTV